MVKICHYELNLEVAVSTRLNLPFTYACKACVDTCESKPLTQLY